MEDIKENLKKEREMEEDFTSLAIEIPTMVNGLITKDMVKENSLGNQGKRMKESGKMT